MWQDRPVSLKVIDHLMKQLGFKVTPERDLRYLSPIEALFNCYGWENVSEVTEQAIEPVDVAVPITEGLRVQSRLTDLPKLCIVLDRHTLTVLGRLPNGNWLVGSKRKPPTIDRPVPDTGANVRRRPASASTRHLGRPWLTSCSVVQLEETGYDEVMAHPGFAEVVDILAGTLPKELPAG